MQPFEALFLTDLEPDESFALHAYKSARDGSVPGRSLCFAVNEQLRRGLRPSDLTSEERRVIDGLDQVFGRTPRLQHNTELFRGIGFRDHLPLHEVGARFRNLEYWSTATNQAQAESFLKPGAAKGRGAILRLHLPAGTPVYDMETLEGAGGSEAEILLSRGLLWQVESATLVQSGELSSFTMSSFENIVRVDLRAQP